MAVSWHDHVFGFAGLGGLKWLAGIFASRAGQPEDLTPEQVAAPGSQAVDILGERVAFIDEGSGDPPLLFIHGFGESTRTWDFVRPAFAPRHRTVAVDLWGFGASARPAGLKPVGWVRQVEGLLDHLGLAPAVLVGHSLGGCVSLMCASEMPQRVRALVLVNADWGQASFGYSLVRLISYTNLLPLALSRLRGGLDPIRTLVTQIAGPKLQVTDEQIAIFRDYFRVQDTLRTWRSLGRSQHWRDVHRLPPTIECQALVVCGEEDGIIPLDWGKKLAATLPHGELVTVPGSGHFPQEDDPQAVITPIEAFLSRLQSPTKELTDGSNPTAD
jgi:pimeloyl-ACP methyl ester carboxylesterase